MTKAEYELTLLETLGTPVDTVNYAYTDSNFKNGVPLYDGTDSIVYDANGNPTSYRGYIMEWVKGRQLESMTDGTNTLSFKYDSSGIRTKKTVNGVETEYFYVGDMLVSQKTGNEVINFAYTAGGAPYGFTYNGIPYFYLLNLQGDIISIYDSEGEIVVDYIYDTWGKLISITGSLADTIGVKNPLRYRGYYYDTSSGLYYLQSRYYNPEMGRFINADTLLIAGDDTIQGTNMFAYCYNNPVMYVDPRGCSSDKITNSSVQLAIDISRGIIGAYLFDVVCKSFGIDGIAKLDGALGEIVDMEFEVYEFKLSDLFEDATSFGADLFVSGATGALMTKLLYMINLSNPANLFISTVISTAIYKLLEKIELKSGNYVLLHFSFLELRESWPIGDFFVHDFFFLYYQSNDKDYKGDLIDEYYSPYKFWYKFSDM